MNSKTLKNLRATVRVLIGLKAPIRNLLRPTRVVMVPDYTRGLKLDGTPHLIPMEFPLPATNDPSSHRGIYRRIKKQRKAGTATSQAR